MRAAAALPLLSRQLSPDLHDVRVMQHPVQHRRSHRLIVGESSGPLDEGSSVGFVSSDRRRPFQSLTEAMFGKDVDDRAFCDVVESHRQAEVFRPVLQRRT